MKPVEQLIGPCALPATASQAEVIGLVEVLNADPEVSGILVLRPLPSHVAEAAMFRAFDPCKDIDAVHPENAGLLALGVPRFVHSTAASVFHLLDTWLDSVGKDRAAFYHRSLIVVVGRLPPTTRPTPIGTPRCARCARRPSGPAT